MNKFLINLLLSVLGSLPGGDRIAKGARGLLHPDNDPTNNLEETAQNVVDLAIGGIQVAEGLGGKELLKEDAIPQLQTDLLKVIRDALAVKP